MCARACVRACVGVRVRACVCVRVQSLPGCCRRCGGSTSRRRPYASSSPSTTVSNAIDPICRPPLTRSCQCAIYLTSPSTTPRIPGRESRHFRLLQPQPEFQQGRQLRPHRHDCLHHPDQRGGPRAGARGAREYLHRVPVSVSGGLSAGTVRVRSLAAPLYQPGGAAGVSPICVDTPRCVESLADPLLPLHSLHLPTIRAGEPHQDPQVCIPNEPCERAVSYSEGTHSHDAHAPA